MSWLCIHYYTPKYTEEFEGLSQSIGEFDIPRYSKKIASLGNWNLNTHYKATFIRECLDKFGKNDLVYVDVDARFEKYPELFDNIVDDVAYWLNTYPNGARNELCSGTLFFKNNDKSREICDKWIDLCKDNFELLEQDKLKQAIKATKDVKTFILPVEYCAIYDHPLVRGIEPVISHYQASRRLK